MVSTSLLLLPASALLAAALPGAFPPYVPPGPNDVRSPCPALNSIANHGFIPHSGKGLNNSVIVQGLSTALNLDPNLAATLAAGALLTSSNPLSGDFDLDNLDEHNVIEHDASLSRWDAYFGDDHTFNQTIFDQTISYYKGMKTTTIPAAARARYARYQTSMATNPQFSLDPVHTFLSYGESALYLSIMGNPISGRAPINYVKIFFEQERLPYIEGWRKPKIVTSSATLTAMITKLQAATPNGS